ncbi:MAG: SDR family oxidoreductase [Treponemataceae bacterium]
MRLKNKVCIVTGAATGIGEAIAKRFADEGAIVYIADLNLAQATATAARIGGNGNRAAALELDVTKEPSWVAALEAVMKKEGRIDILVNNAGILKRIALTEMPVEDFDAVMAVNVRGPFLGIKHVIPIMQKGGGGNIVNMSSICGLIGHKYSNDTYITSKGAVTLLTKAVAVKYAKDNIRCNSIHPSTVNTPLVQELFKDPVKKQERIGEIPMGRLAAAEDVANAALFLASDEASFITGVGLPVDGGLTAS